MHDVTSFGLDVLLVAAALSAALLASKLSARVSVPSAALFLVAAAVASDVLHSLTLSTKAVERIRGHVLAPQKMCRMPTS